MTELESFKASRPKGTPQAHTKYWLEQIGSVGGPVRRPLLNLDDAEKAVIRDAIGSLDKVKQIVALTGFVNSEPDFFGHPQVVNGASELLVELFGDRGKHSRTALGAAALPLNVAVEINLIVEVGD